MMTHPYRPSRYYRLESQSRRKFCLFPSRTILSYTRFPLLYITPSMSFPSSSLRSTFSIAYFYASNMLSLCGYLENTQSELLINYSNYNHSSFKCYLLDFSFIRTSSNFKMDRIPRKFFGLVILRNICGAI